ncbi:MAG: type II secretory pathway pseudopilin PulG [Planctomycetota bacterium]|jgi:type II secretory pathway pseudopilin PulG
MKTSRRVCNQRAKTSSGFTILEMVVAATIFGGLSYVLLIATKMGTDSQRTVTEAVARSKKLRAVSDSLANELVTTTADLMTMTVEAGGCTELSFMAPITLAGLETWGVHDRMYGPDDDDQNKVDWRIRYTVKDLGDAGHLSRTLVRQILNAADEVQEEEAVIDDLTTGVNPPAFVVEQSGAMWEITITKAGNDPNDAGEETTFYVRTRN